LRVPDEIFFAHVIVTATRMKRRQARQIVAHGVSRGECASGIIEAPERGGRIFVTWNLKFKSQHANSFAPFKGFEFLFDT
jgi:hypothetical protein